MKYAFDFHGTINKYPDTFKKLMKFLMQESSIENPIEENLIYILSGPPKNQIIKELTKAGFIKNIHYDIVASVVDWLKSSGAKMRQDKKGDWWTDDETWWKSKRRICKEYGIDILFDDKLQYKKGMDQNKTLFFHVD